MLYSSWARIYDCTNSQNGTNSKIPNCPSHWLYLNCAFLINSGGVISVFPAWTVSALLANFSLSLLFLFLPLSASFLCTPWSLFDLHHGGRNRNGCGERTRVRASDRVNDRTPHNADIQEWITHKTPGSQSYSTPPHPANTPFPISVRIRMDAEQGNTVSSSWNSCVYENSSPFEGSAITQTLLWKIRKRQWETFLLSLNGLYSSQRKNDFGPTGTGLTRSKWVLASNPLYTPSLHRPDCLWLYDFNVFTCCYFLNNHE